MEPNFSVRRISFYLGKDQPMIVIPQKPSASLLKVAAVKTIYPAKTISIYRPRPFKRVNRPKTGSAVIPFDLWIMPEQEQGYIKCRRFDFL
jgi:hypothetical protein